MGHIGLSTSPWNSPVFVIKKKKSGKFRFLHDLRAIDASMQAMRATQPGLPALSAIPNNYDIITIDIKDYFSSIPLHPDDKQKFTFSFLAENNRHPMQRHHWRILP